jgi:hypothetical protein
MLRTAAREEIRNVAAPLWLLINHSLWPAKPGEFDVIRNGASSIVAHLAYCAIGADEREKRNRAKVVPCEVFQKLLISEEVDFIEALAGRDFAEIEVVRTRAFVAVIIPARTLLLIGIRGTQFAYDWLINVNIAKARDQSGAYFHAGFLREAQELAGAVQQRLLDRYAKKLANPDCAIYLAGHSLGGAVAAILNQMQLAAPINECYTFGTPRISKSNHFASLSQPFATRRDLDIVPHCPPSAFNYADFGNQKTTNGNSYVSADGIELYFFSSWLFGLAINRFLESHSMERYRFEILEEAKRHPRNQPYWKAEWPDFASWA